MAPTIAVYTEKGGVGKSTSTVGLAAALAAQGHRVLVWDLDPRATTTAWLDVEPAEEGMHVGAILADPDPTGWAADLAVDVPWSASIKAIPSHRNLALRESGAGEYPEGKLKAAMTGFDWADVVVVDLPNRPGGPLVRAGLAIATTVLYAATGDEDGYEGVRDAVASVARFRQTPWNPGIADGGVVMCKWPVVASRDARRVLEDLRTTEGFPPVLEPVIPERVVVRESRAGRVWWGDFEAGQIVARAYDAIAAQLVTAGA